MAGAIVEPSKTVSPILPADTAVESGHLAPGLAGSDAKVEVRVVPLIAVDDCFLTVKGIELRDDVEFDWESAPENVLRLLAGLLHACWTQERT